MGTSIEQLQAEWRDEIAQITALIDDLRARIDAELQLLRSHMDADVASLQSRLRKLTAEVEAMAPTAYARQIGAQIEELRAKSDAAYQLLQIGEDAQLDATETEIKQLELAALHADGEERTRLLARIAELRSAYVASQAIQTGGDSPATR